METDIMQTQVNAGAKASSSPPPQPSAAAAPPPPAKPFPEGRLRLSEQVCQRHRLVLMPGVTLDEFMARPLEYLTRDVHKLHPGDEIRVLDDAASVLAD